MKSKMPLPDEGHELFIENFQHFIEKDLFRSIGPKLKLSYLYTMLYHEGGITEKLEGLLKFKLKPHIQNKLLDLLHKSPVEQWAAQHHVVKALENLLSNMAEEIKASLPELLSAQQQQEFVSMQSEPAESLYRLQFNLPVRSSHLQTFQQELETLYHFIKDLQYLLRFNLSTTWLGFDPLKVSVLEINRASTLAINQKFRPLNQKLDDYHADFVGKKWLLQLLNEVFDIALQHSQVKPKKHPTLTQFNHIAQQFKMLLLLQEQQQKLSKKFIGSVYNLQLAIYATKMKSIPLIQEISL